MRHGKSFNHLGRKSEHRKAMLANMASSLILHKRIETTTAKAKALRQYVEPLITKSKEDSTNSRRVVFSYLKDKTAVTELFREVSGKIAERPGGYTRILKTGTRLGDSAEMCIIELVDYNENMLSAGEDKKSKSKRRRGGKKKATDQVQATKKETTEEIIVESPVEKVEEKATETVQDIENINEAEIIEPEVKSDEPSEDKAEETKNEEKE